MEIITKSPETTHKLGKDLGSSLKGGEVVALCGPMGAGKTTFVQGLAEGLGIDSRIVSPTFIIMRKYKVSVKDSDIHNLYHVDLYRLENNIESQIEELGITSLWGEKENVFVIEWADMLEKIKVPNMKKVEFKILGNNNRSIIV